MKIRSAYEGDIPALLDLLQQVGQIHHRGRPDLFRANAQKYSRQELLSLLNQPDRPVFVAETENRVVGYGFCMLHCTESSPVFCDCRSLYIDDLCVDQACRGQGVGYRLYEHIRDYARSVGCRSITLNVWAFNQEAMNFYKTCGLTPQKIVMESILEDPDAGKK